MKPADLAKLLSSERLLYIPPSAGGAKEAADFFSRNRAFLKDAWGDREDAYYTEKYWRDKLADDAGRMARGTDARFWLVKRGGGGAFAGVIALHQISGGRALSGNLSYAIDAEEAGKGCMTEAARHFVVEIAFGAFGLHRVETAVMPRNKASVRVLEKCGFEKEGLSRGFLRINDVWEDHLRYARINERDGTAG
jgi:ribosomal-protein-alanine N-acetyltransferase